MTDKLQGKVAIVTGASSGIGQATALALAEEGAKVVVSGRRLDRLQQVVSEIVAKGGDAYAVPGDIAVEADANNLITQAKERYGRIDILVNNAGVMLLGPIFEANTEDWRRMVNTNVLGLLYGIHAVLPIMKEQQSGHIVNISSVAGRTARSGAGVYNATKWGVGGLSEALRQEVLSDHIRVTIVEPGAVATELTHHITNEKAKATIQDWIKNMTPLQSEDIAAGIVYAVTQPAHVNVNEILIRPTDQPT